MKKIIFYLFFLLVPAVNNTHVAEIDLGKKFKNELYFVIKFNRSWLKQRGI